MRTRTHLPIISEPFSIQYLVVYRYGISLTSATEHSTGVPNVSRPYPTFVQNNYHLVQRRSREKGEGLLCSSKKKGGGGGYSSGSDKIPSRLSENSVVEPVIPKIMIRIFAIADDFLRQRLRKTYRIHVSCRQRRKVSSYSSAVTLTWKNIKHNPYRII